MNGAPSLAISSDVLYGIAQLALDKVEGVRAMQSPNRMGEILSGKRARGISIEREGELVYVDLTVSVTYGVEIPKAAAAAQKAVRDAVVAMTGLSVASVNVTVETITMPESEQGG
ncbi:MAG: Asp23/Gls24 family envelope stress response protein [Trueperaceae bacterium]|nr:Asp23/Gls24 family envelope stress response protein [Trueperaceae bacterium]